MDNIVVISTLGSCAYILKLGGPFSGTRDSASDRFSGRSSANDISGREFHGSMNLCGGSVAPGS